LRKYVIPMLGGTAMIRWRVLSIDVVKVRLDCTSHSRPWHCCHEGNNPQLWLRCGLAFRSHNYFALCDCSSVLYFYEIGIRVISWYEDFLPFQCRGADYIGRQSSSS
jgi:hypothetical protein